MTSRQNAPYNSITHSSVDMLAERSGVVKCGSEAGFSVGRVSDPARRGGDAAYNVRKSFYQLCEPISFHGRVFAAASACCT